ncbi:MAG TPA: adenosine deaminase [Mycobacteriales bacterium]|nr:adenosine deaminase [Mycobacteriales bacterium]
MPNSPLALLPKVELHCHVEGTMRPSTVAELAARNGLGLPTDDPTELYHYVSLDDFLRVFWLVQSTLGSRDDWARLAYESVLDAAAAGVAYRETFFTPARHLAAGQDLAGIVAGLTEGLAAGEKETGTRVMLVCDMDRAYGGAAGRELVEQLVQLRRAGAAGTERVLGIGMDSTELGVDPAAFADAYRLAGTAGLRRTAHQGETTPAATIAVAVDELGAERIDHALSILDDAELTRRLADRRIPLTVCPTSNIRIANAVERLEDHPYAAMRSAGLLATLNTDDPAMIDLDLATEYALVQAAYGYSWDDMVAIALDGVEATWLDADDRRRLADQVQEAATQLRPAAE